MAKGESKYLQGRKAQATAQQRQYIDKTILRRGRIERLNALKEEAKEEEMAKLEMLVPDGVPLLNGHEASTFLTASNAASLLLKHDDDDDDDDTSHVNNNSSNNENKSENKEDEIMLPKPRSCYTCKVRFQKLHPFYDQLCPQCAQLNFDKRNFTCDLSNRVAIVTGSRVKIGFQTCLKLLRAGCTVIATTRFPNAACRAYMNVPDFDTFKHRLHVYGLDLRDIAGLEAFTRYIINHYSNGNNNGIDILINNACQTIRRPVGYYKAAVEEEQDLFRKACTNDEDFNDHRMLLSGSERYERIRYQMNMITNTGTDNESSEKNRSETKTETIPSIFSEPSVLTSKHEHEFNNGNINKKEEGYELDVTSALTGVSYSTRMSQVALLPEDIGIDRELLPEGLTDVNGSQLDLRRHNSWLLKMEEVSTPEVVETMFINAISPFVLNSRLKPLMIAGGDDRPDRYIINVSAMEGKFYRYKTPNHPHTNMAKAALNMMTRTSAEDLAKNCRIFMNSVDTGWINDENPLEKASQTAKNNHFQTPIDEVDAAARILDPIFTGVSKGERQYGLFLKDYRESEW